jgi:calcineurin-like phosphoesterase family protein
LVHGHCHGRWRRNQRMIDVGVDAWGGRPVAAHEVAGLFLGDDEHAGVLTWPTP